MSQYFPKPFRSFGGNINVKVDLSNYATKTAIDNKILSVRSLVKKQIITQKLVSLKRNILI